MSKLIVERNSYIGNIIDENMTKVEFFEFKPKTTLTNGEVKKIKLLNLKMAQKLLIKKLYLKMQEILDDFDDNDDPSTGDLKKALDEVERLRTIIKNKYAMYLDEEKVQYLLNKTKGLLHEIGMRTIEKENEMLENLVNDEPLKEGRSR